MEIERTVNTGDTEVLSVVLGRTKHSYLAPESEVLHFGFEVANVGDLRSIFTEDRRKRRPSE